MSEIGINVKINKSTPTWTGKNWDLIIHNIIFFFFLIFQQQETILFSIQRRLYFVYQIAFFRSQNYWKNKIQIIEEIRSHYRRSQKSEAHRNFEKYREQIRASGEGRELKNFEMSSFHPSFFFFPVFWFFSFQFFLICNSSYT